MTNKGKFIISLDFEIHWGVRDKKTVEDYKANLLGVRDAVPAMLAIFDKYNIHVTFSTVGLLFFKNKSELLAGLPDIKPNYKDANLSPYPTLESDLGESEQDDLFHYAPTLIQLIKDSGQEISTHTFSHYYCLENGQTLEAFREDLKAAIRIAQAKGIEIKSIVFPRNQFNREYIQVCRELGFTSYRGNPKSWIYSARPNEKETLIRRLVRLLDDYFDITGHNCYSLTAIAQNKPYNIPFSKFLRPYSEKAKLLSGLRLKRILNQMTYAARNNMMYHLYWHPHNFGVNLSDNIKFLEKILLHFQFLSEKFSYQSMGMDELSDYIDKHLAPSEDLLMKGSPLPEKIISGDS